MVVDRTDRTFEAMFRAPADLLSPFFGPLVVRPCVSNAASTTGRLPWPHAVHTPGGDHPSTIGRTKAGGNAAKWSTPTRSGTCNGELGMSHTDPGSFPSGLNARVRSGSIAPP